MPLSVYDTLWIFYCKSLEYAYVMQNDLDGGISKSMVYALWAPIEKFAFSCRKQTNTILTGGSLNPYAYHGGRLFFNV